MYIKWIGCRVKKNERQNFSKAQEKWERTSGAKGFIAQTGGWDLQNKNIACLISFWENKDSLEVFMKDLHEEIIKDNKQTNTYSEIFVEYFTRIFNMEGEAGTLKEAVQSGNLLRIADCTVKPDKIKHFEKMQSEIWLPGMWESNGMLAEIFSKNNNNNLRYLVSTLWDNFQNHTNYSHNKLPHFRDQSDAANDISEITRKQISIVDAWKVIKS
jgi:quinol monooxygenase YgiN